jgi:hypothetical protein
VNLASAEYGCVQEGLGVFEYSVSDSQLADQMAALGVKTVRLPLNEHCWLGDRPEFSYIPSHKRGDPYRDRIESMVSELNQRGITAILDLHWNAATGPADEQQKMADARYAPAFWSSVADRFAANDMVIFDLYNEPQDISWECWRDGCWVDGWELAGMQDLVDAVRATGASQPIILSGIDWANDLRGWLDHVPDDPAGNLVAGFHAYNRGPGFTKRCITENCWDTELLPIINAGYPVFAAEVGQDIGYDGCATDFVERFYTWADRHQVRYTAWSYNPHGCGAPSLIASYDGTLSPAGQVLASRLN